MISMRTSVVSSNQAGRDLVVGDVHGCFRTLDRALREIAFDPACDRLFGVGDLVNRGPHSAEALEWLEERFTAVVMGNHEPPVRSWFRAKLLKGRPPSSPWLRAIPPEHYQRWCDALHAMPLALAIETRHGLVGVVHAEPPDRVWSVALDLLQRASDAATDVALLGYETREEREAARSRPIEGLRALVHGHWPVKEVETSHNRWNIDTGAGLPNGRLSLVEVNALELRTWTFDVVD